MKSRSVWLHNPTGSPKKVQLKVSDTEISLGEFVVPAKDVASCKVTYPFRVYGLLVPLMVFGLFAWWVAEFLSFIIRLQSAVLVELTPNSDAAAAHAQAVALLQKLHLRSSTTDDQQMQLAFWLFIAYFIYCLFVTHFIFRPRILLVSSEGGSAERPYLFVRPRKFVKTLAAARKVVKRAKATHKTKPSE
jgi:hypothetical protein